MDFEQLKQTCLVCEKCDLCCTRTHVVFGTGNPNAEVLFIGEAPGRNEDEQGLPFVGRSGQLLDQYLKAIHLDREKNVFITNIVKCRPPENRDPLPNEWDACIPYLREQFRLIKPKIVVCLGRIAAQRIIRPDYSVMKEHGQCIAAHLEEQGETVELIHCSSDPDSLDGVICGARKFSVVDATPPHGAVHKHTFS